MGLFSSSTPTQVCGLAFCDYGLRTTVMACDDRTQGTPLDPEFLPLVSGKSLPADAGLDDTLEALSGDVVPMLEHGYEDDPEDLDIDPEFDVKLDQLAATVDDIDGYEGETVVGVPMDYSQASRDTLRRRIESCGFDVQQVVSNDAASSVLAGVEYEIEHGGAGLHPIVIVTVDIWEVTVTFAEVNVEKGQVRVRARDSIQTGVLNILEYVSRQAYVRAGVPEDEISIQLTSMLYPLVRDLFDAETETSAGAIEWGGEQVRVTVHGEDFEDIAGDMLGFCEAAATGFVLDADYVPEDVHQVLISGFGTEGSAGFELSELLASQFVSPYSAAAEYDHEYDGELVTYGNLPMPDIGAADIAREAHEGTPFDVSEPLDITLE